MKTIDYNLCKQCELCVKECPLEAININQEGFPVILENCAECNSCVKICPTGAITDAEDTTKNYIECRHCRVLCKIKEGYTGACRRYCNKKGLLVRDTPLHFVTHKRTGNESRKLIEKPLITAIGAGTEFPCFYPAPYIANDKLEGVDVVTAVSEVPVSYSSIRVKVDTNKFIGKPGAKVKRDGKEVGMIISEEYGSMIISIGGINLITGNRRGNRKRKYGA